MPINTQYYGSESSWIDFKPVAGMTDDFKVASFSTAVASLGYSARTWLATKCGMNYDDYKKPLDVSFCWCGTDGTAPFDNIFGVTGYNNNHDRYQVNQNGKSSIGLGTKGNDTSYIRDAYCQYFKVSASGGAEWGNAPLNFQPEYAFAATVDSYTGGLKVLRLSNGGLTPALKFNFNNYYLVPFIHYYVLKSTATLTDWGNVTDPTNYSSLVDATKCDDLYTFCKRIEDQTYFADKIVIFAITGLINHVVWQNDKSYNINDVSFGTQTATSGLIQGFAVNENTVELEFADWYDTSEDQKTYKIKIDASLINNRGYAVGTCGIYNGKAGQITTGTFNSRNSIALAGCPLTTGVGYYSGVSGAPYIYEPFSRDVSKFHVKNFSADSSLPNARRYGYNFTSTISDYSNLNGFREYVRKACAYYGMFFSEMMYPDATQDWISEDAYVGTIDSSGITHGAYTHGADNANQPQRTWGDEWATKTPYEPGKQPKPDHDPNNYIDTMQGRNTNYLQGFTRLYAVDGFNMLILRGFLANIPNMGTTLEDHQEYLYKHFLNSNPIDNIVSLKMYPFSLVDYVLNNSPTVEVIKISNADVEYTVGSSTLRAMGTTSGLPATQITLQLGKFTLYTAYGDFRDYEPYSSAKMYLPFCGTASIDIKTILDKELYVAYKVDVKTGSCTAIVTQDSYDGIIVLTAHGTLSVEIPVSGMQTADYQNAIFQGITNLKNAQVNQFTAYIHAATGVINAAQSAVATPTGLSGIAGGIGAAITSDNNLNQAEYNLQSARINHTMIGASSAGESQLMYIYPSLIVTRPKFLPKYSEALYAHTVGHACIESDVLGNFNGYTVVSDIDMSGVDATETEKSVLRSILAAGIYL